MSNAGDLAMDPITSKYRASITNANILLEMLRLLNFVILPLVSETWKNTGQRFQANKCVLFFFTLTPKLQYKTV